MIRATSAVWVLLSLASCSKAKEEAVALTGGDPGRGANALRQYGCGSCHAISGITGATAKTATPLDHIGSRAFLHGQEPNTPEAMIRWIQHPQKQEPGNAMPELNVSEKDARDMAAYLYTLK